MKPFELFKAGKHTASGGASLSFSAEDLQAAVAAYDPAVHEAPIVVGHPKDNAPAYGWVKSLAFADGGLEAEPDQVDPAFAANPQQRRAGSQIGVVGDPAFYPETRTQFAEAGRFRASITGQKSTIRGQLGFAGEF